MAENKTLLTKITEKLFAPLFHKDISYNGQYPSFIDKMEPSSRLKYESYLNFIQINQDRKAAYKQYEEMDMDIVAACLDLYSDDATQMNLEDGESFYVDCANPEIKAELEDMFFNQLHIDEQLWSIVRTFAKYGDYFVRVVGQENIGVQYIDYNIHPSRFTRIDTKGVIKCFIIDETVQLNPWDVVHFKLPGAVQFPKEGEYTQVSQNSDLNNIDNAYTYGTSALSNARKTWKQLNLLEDSLILTRLSRAFKRNIFSVNTAGLTEVKAWEMVDKIAALLKRNKAINSGQGMQSYTTLMNPEEDIVIPVSNEKGTLSVQEIGGDADIQHIADLDYTKSKLYGDLKTPKAYLGFEEALNGRNTLRMMDVRYARTIKNLQRVLILGLERIARIHLALKGYDPFQFEFRIVLPYVSTIEEAEKTEALSNKLDAVTKVVALFDQIDDGHKLINKLELLKYMFDQLGLSESEIGRMLAPQETEETE